MTHNHRAARPLLTQMIFMITALIVVSMMQLAQAQTRYVTDQLQALLRAGTGTEYRIITLLTSGTQVEVLDANAGNGYSRVRAGNRTGYILTRELSDEPSPRDRLEAALARVEPLQTENENLKSQLDELQSELTQTQNQNDELTATNGQLKASLERLQRTSDNAVKIDQRNRALEEENRTLKSDLEIIRQENNALQNNTRQRWLLTGGFIAFIGLLAGLIIPKLRMRPDNRWSNQL